MANYMETEFKSEKNDCLELSEERLDYLETELKREEMVK